MGKKTIIGVISIIVIVLTGFMIALSSGENESVMTYNAFLREIESGNVSEVKMSDNEYLQVTLADDNLYQVPNPEKDELKEFLLLNDISVESSNSTDVTSMVSSLVVVAAILLGVWYRRKGDNKNKQFVKDVNKRNTQNEGVIKFDNVAGNDEAKEMVKDIIDFIKNPGKYTQTGAKMPKGILLYGAPGTGKTLLAKAIAGEAGVPFYALTGSDFVQMYVGVGAKRVRELFAKARKSEKAVIFIDEIDALGKSRGNNKSSANDEREQTLNALLTEMSGFNSTDGIVVIGATNRADTLDEALLRPGRFDRQIEVALPDKKAREEIIGLYLKDKPIADDVNLMKLAQNTVMFSGAMLENIVNEAAIIAANKNNLIINNGHFDTAFYNVVAGMEKKNTRGIISDEEKRITAYHEAGHALVSRLLLPNNRISKVTIIPTTKGAAGYNFAIPEDKMFRKKHEILSHIRVLLAGRATEEIVFSEENITTGAVNDIKEASKEIYAYFNQYGMDESNGLFSLEINNALDDKIFDDCRVKMKALYQETKALIRENAKILDILAEELIRKETLSGEEIDVLIGYNSISCCV